jgi:hypothetical protein
VDPLLGKPVDDPVRDMIGNSMLDPEPVLTIAGGSVN